MNSFILFPVASKKLKKNVQRINHGLRRALIIIIPEIALMTKFVEINVISKNISSFNFRL